jgi:catechol 2,3-dioxygenase-like lactoylglutathione lyase family enzyme
MPSQQGEYPMNPQTVALSHLVPILYVADFGASLGYFVDKLGFKKAWDWGEPPSFGCVARDGLEIFLCQGGQGQPGTWMSIFVENVDGLHAELSARGAKIVRPPQDEPWGMREFLVEELNGHTFRFGQSAKNLKIERAPLDARIEKRLLSVLSDLAARTNRSLGEVLEETLLHSFEQVPGHPGAVASPHSPKTFGLIDELKLEHGLDYETHASYRFTEG